MLGLRVSDDMSKEGLLDKKRWYEKGRKTGLAVYNIQVKGSILDSEDEDEIVSNYRKICKENISQLLEKELEKIEDEDINKKEVVEDLVSANMFGFCDGFGTDREVKTDINLELDDRVEVIKTIKLKQSKEE